jgi:hypothetical protein
MKYKMRKGKVKMIKVYQIQLTDAEIAAVNNGETSDRIQAYFTRSFAVPFKAENFQYYTHVANVDLDNMEHAFEAMNLWEESIYFEDVFKLAPCSSMSVGDILDVDGKLFRCATFGFEAI